LKVKVLRGEQYYSVSKGEWWKGTDRIGTEEGYCEHGNELILIKFSLLCIYQIHNLSTANKMHYNVYDVYYSQFSHQPIHHTLYTSPTRWINTHHTTTSSITLHTLHNFNSQDFNHYPFLTYIYITYIILTEIIIIFNCCGVMTTQLTTFVTLYSFNNNITLKIAALASQTHW
jgi:hypothetical protein